MTTHSWLGNDGAPSSWAPPQTGATPPPPPPPTGGTAPATVLPPSLPAAVPLPAAPEAHAPTASALPPAPSGYDAPAPDSRWHTYLQRGEHLAQPSRDRPRAIAPAVLLVAGASLAVLGSLLTWATFPDAVADQGVPRTFNGFTELVGESKDGPFFIAFAALLAAFGLTLLFARRVAALLILGAILAGFGAIAAVIDLLDVADPDGVAAASQPSVGVGLPLVVAGFVVAFAGTIVGLVTGRTQK